MFHGAESLEALLARAEDLDDPAARELCRELAREVLDLHRAGLERMLAWMSGEPLERALRDELIAALVQLHDLHPSPRVQRTEPALVPAQSLVRRGRDTAREPCSLCAAPLGGEHQHLFEVANRRLVCACEACVVLLSSRADTRYRRVFRRAERLSGFRMSEDAWGALRVPVGLAFLSVASSRDEVIAAYPGPAGAIEAPVDRRAWDALAADNPVLGELAPDIEALLVHRMTEAHEYLRVSIDACYRLTGLVRSRWQGISGGEEVARVVREFMRSLGEAPP